MGLSKSSEPHPDFRFVVHHRQHFCAGEAYIEI